ncbi:MAG: hypothetical protein ABFS56_17435 [Pseudomonadota bacterium]
MAVVSTGSNWKFLKLENGTVYIDFYEYLINKALFTKFPNNTGVGCYMPISPGVTIGLKAMAGPYMEVRHQCKVIKPQKGKRSKKLLPFANELKQASY